MKTSGKILITGGTGFVGSNLARKLVRDGEKVVIIARSPDNSWRIQDIISNLEIRFSDLADFKKIRQIVQKEKPKGIFHLGASVIASGIMAEPDKVLKVNFLGTKNLIEALGDIDYEFFINTSTFTDQESTDDYAKSKLHAAQFCAEFAQKNSKPIVTLRLFTVYGPFIPKGRLIFNVLSNAIRGDDIKMTSPSVTRDFVFVDDIADLYLKAAKKADENKGGIFNAGSGVKTDFKEVVETALKIADSKSKVVWGVSPSASYDSDKWQADIKETTAKLDWKPKTTFFSGMQKTHEWLKENLYLYQ